MVMKRYLSQALDTLFPPRCTVSGQPVEMQGMVAPKVFKDLSFISAPFCVRCGMPFEFETSGETDEDLECGACIDHPPAYNKARAALAYNDTSRDMILGFKHGDKTLAVRSFTPWMKRAGEVMLVDADLIIPVPLHYLRLVKRRYNQASILASWLGREANIPVCAGALRRVRSTKTQGHLSYKDRAKNVKKAFSVNSKHIETIKSKRIVLIDDVLTTGSTVNECAKILLESGAAQVDVLCVARVVKN